MTKYVQMRRSANRLHDLSCPVCRQRLRTSDLPPPALALARTPLAVARAPNDARGLAIRPMPATRIRATTVFCCCVVVAQLCSTMAVSQPRRRSRVCLATAAALWVICLLWLGATVALNALDATGALGNATATAGSNPLRDAPQHWDRQSAIFQLHCGLFALLLAAWCFALCVVFAARRHLARHPPTGAARRYALPSDALDEPIVCLPCAMSQMLAYMGYTPRNYRLLAPLPSMSAPERAMRLAPAPAPLAAPTSAVSASQGLPPPALRCPSGRSDPTTTPAPLRSLQHEAIQV